MGRLGRHRRALRARPRVGDALGLRRAQTRAMPVGGGPVVVVDAGDVVFLQRHGAARLHARASNRPPRARPRARARRRATGCSRSSSVGGHCGRSTRVGTVLVPDDFIASRESTGLPLRRRTRPFGAGVRPRAGGRECWPRGTSHAAHGPPSTGGCTGRRPGRASRRPAEVRYLATFADVVGMTVGRSECNAMRERGIAYAAVCIVDNLGQRARRPTRSPSRSSKPARRRTARCCIAHAAGLLPELCRMTRALTVDGCGRSTARRLECGRSTE